MHPKRNYYSRLKAAGTFSGTIKAAIILRNKRDAAAPTTTPRNWQKDLRAKRIITIPLGHAARNYGYQAARKINGRVKNWQTPVATTAIHATAKLLDTDEGRYSSRCTFHHIAHHIAVTSYGFISTAGRVLRYRYRAEPLRSIKAPHGYRWDRDRNGIKLVSLANARDDFHPDTDDIVAGAKHCAAKLRENAKRRREIATRERLEARKTRQQREQEQRIIRKAEREGLTVCLADSLKAGNCRAGTLNWATRHGYDPTRHYTPSELLANANGDTPRVALVVAVALRRHRSEMERGYAELSDHRTT